MGMTLFLQAVFIEFFCVWMNSLLGYIQKGVTLRTIFFCCWKEDTISNIDLDFNVAAQIHLYVLVASVIACLKVKMDIFSWPLYGLYVC